MLVLCLSGIFRVHRKTSLLDPFFLKDNLSRHCKLRLNVSHIKNAKVSSQMKYAEVLFDSEIKLSHLSKLNLI